MLIKVLYTMPITTLQLCHSCLLVCVCACDLNFGKPTKLLHLLFQEIPILHIEITLVLLQLDCIAMLDLQL